MGNNDKDSNTDIEPLSPVSDLIDLTDKALDRAYRSASNLFNNYSEVWSDQVDDTLSATIPTFFHKTVEEALNASESLFAREFDNDDKHPWHRHWRRRCGKNQENLSSVFQIEGATYTSANDSFGGELGIDAASNQEFINLDQSKPKDLYAYPVPSGRQYSQCKAYRGTSLWTREGVWRCLFPASSEDQSRLDSALGRSRANSSNFFPWGSNSLITDSESSADLLKKTQVFPDITTYLDWKVGVRNALRESRARAHSEWQSKFNKAFEIPQPKAAEFSPEPIENEVQPAQQQIQPAQEQQIVPSQEPSHRPVMISEEDAKAQNKKVVSSSYTYSTYATGDGAFEVKKSIKKKYSDGTESLTENVSSSADKNPSGSDKESSGWFWK